MDQVAQHAPPSQPTAAAQRHGTDMSDEQANEPDQPSDHEPGAEAPTHPEEMRATFEFRARDWFSGKLTARATPAGMVGLALLATAILVPLVIMVKANRR
jgi:hypothetical protein